jgi:hypothetical protein
VPIHRGGAIQVRGLDELRAGLKNLDDAAYWEDQLATANEYVAEYVADAAEPRMRGLGGMGARAAATLEARRSGKAGRIALGGPSAPFAAGVEFGAHRNVRRVIKNTRARPTIVRDGENIDRVIGNIENQSIEAGSRKTSYKRFRGRGDVIGVRAVRVIRGWNQFKPWKGNGSSAGYALFPTIRERQREIVAIYEKETAEITKAAFPD